MYFICNRKSRQYWRLQSLVFLHIFKRGVRQIDERHLPEWKLAHFIMVRRRFGGGGECETLFTACPRVVVELTLLVCVVHCVEVSPGCWSPDHWMSLIGR